MIPAKDISYYDFVEPIRFEMGIENLEHPGTYKLVHFYDTHRKFECYIAIDSIVLGPALGGCRVMHYKKPEDGMLDALRLSRGMTYKNSLAGLNFGGGKAVVILAEDQEKTPDLMRFVGEAINTLNGEYITAEDVGTVVEDMKYIREKTPYVATLGGSGDPSPWTALGVFECMKAAAQYRFEENLETRMVWVEGLGKVGWALAKLLCDNGVACYVNDIRPEMVSRAVTELGARQFNGQLIDIYAPCAVGQVVNENNYDKIRYPIICGSSNNQLVKDEYNKTLAKNGVLYCPDYLVNSGGVINVSCEVGSTYDPAKAESLIKDLAGRLLKTFELADHLSITPVEAANQLAELRLA